MKEFLVKKDRTNTNSMKWDQVKEVFQTDLNDVLPMWVADMDFPAPKEVNNALIDRATHGIYGYTYIDESIKENVINWIAKRHLWSIQSQWITFSPSVITSLYIAISTFTQPGDKIVIQTPVYTPFFSTIKGPGREIIENPLRFDGTSYEMDYDDLEKKFQAGVKAIVFCSPHNPVGRVWRRDELERLAALAIKYDVLILSDEIHADLTFTNEQHIPIASLSDEVSSQTITFMSPTKTFNLAGLHISYVVTPNSRLRATMEKTLALQGFRMQNTMGIVALDAAYRHGEPWLNKLLTIVENNKQIAIRRLHEETDGKLTVIDSEGTYLLWINFAALNMSDIQLKHFLVNEARVGLNAGIDYGNAGKQFMRMNIACHEATLHKGVTRIVEAIRKL